MQLVHDWLAQLALFVGALSMSAVLFRAGAQMIDWALKRRGAYHMVRFYAAIIWHGKNYRDDLLWKAIKEQVETHQFSALNVVQFALVVGKVGPATWDGKRLHVEGDDEY